MLLRPSNKVDIAKEGRYVEVGRVGLVPRAEELGGERTGRNDDAEKVHPPLGALGLAGDDVE